MSELDMSKIYDAMMKMKHSKPKDEPIVVFVLSPEDVGILREHTIQFSTGLASEFGLAWVIPFAGVDVLHMAGIATGKGRGYRSWFHALRDLRDTEGFDKWKTYLEFKAGEELTKRDHSWLRNNNALRDPKVGS